MDHRSAAAAVDSRIVQLSTGAKQAAPGLVLGYCVSSGRGLLGFRMQVNMSLPFGTPTMADTLDR